MTQPQQEPVEDGMFPVDTDFFPLDSFEQPNQQQNLVDWFRDVDNLTCGNFAFDDQKDQPAEDGLSTVPVDIGDPIPRDLRNNGEPELESYFGLSDTDMLPVANTGLHDGAAAIDHRPPTEFVAWHFDPTLAELNHDISDLLEYQNHTPIATVPQGSEPCYAEATSLNAFVDPRLTVNHPAIEHGIVSSGSCQATDVNTPKQNIREQSQLSLDASPVRHERPVRRKRTASKPLFPGCLTLELGVQSTTAKKPRKRKTQEQLEVTKVVKSRGACLRCRFEKQKCSGNDPCGSCDEIFGKAYAGQHLQWTACIRPSLADKNVFAYGIKLPENFNVQSSKASGIEIGFRQGWWPLPSSSAFTPAANNFEGNAIFLENLYRSVLKYAGGYDDQSFIQDHNAFIVLLQTSTILTCRSTIGDLIGDNEEHVRQLRALASFDALAVLEVALRPRTLEKFVEPSKWKIVSLIVYIALTLQILLSLFPGDSLTQTHSSNQAHNSMHEHLGLLLLHYLHHLCSKAFSRDSKLFSCFGNAGGNVSLSVSFWSTIASEMSSLPKPSMTSPASEVERKTENLRPALPHSPLIEDDANVGTKTISQRQGTAIKASISRSALGKDSTSHKRVKTQANQETRSTDSQHLTEYCRTFNAS